MCAVPCAGAWLSAQQDSRLLPGSSGGAAPLPARVHGYMRAAADMRPCCCLLRRRLPTPRPLRAGSCGRCYEVACRPTTVRDGYGDSLDRQGSCKRGARVTVTVTDTCPCWYPSNAFSNKRW